jgi:hypothetical protein
MTTIGRIARTVRTVRTVTTYREAAAWYAIVGGLVAVQIITGPTPSPAPASPTFRPLPPFTSTTTTTTVPPTVPPTGPPSSVPAGPAGVRPPGGSGPAGTIPPTTTTLPPIVVVTTTMPPTTTTAGLVCVRPGPPTAPTHVTYRGPPPTTIRPDSQTICVPRKG